MAYRRRWNPDPGDDLPERAARVVEMLIAVAGEVDPELARWMAAKQPLITAVIAKKGAEIIASRPAPRAKPSGSIRVPVTSDYAKSELEIRKPEADDYDEPEVRAVLAAFDGDALVFDPADAEAVWRGLTDLSNMTDELSREPGVSSDERTANRHASQGLATTATKVSEYMPGSKKATAGVSKAAVVRVTGPSSFTVPEAIDLVVAGHKYLSGLPTTDEAANRISETETDGVGYSSTTGSPGRAYTARVTTADPHSLPIEFHLGGAEVLRQHVSQLERAGIPGVREALATLKAATPVSPEDAYKLLWSKGTAEKGTAKDGSWTVKADGSLDILRTYRRTKGFGMKSADIASATGLRSGQDFQVKPDDRGQWHLIVKPHAMPAMIAYLEAGWPHLAAALRAHQLHIAPATGPHAVPAATLDPLGAAQPRPAAPSVPARTQPQLDPRQGSAGRIRWRWDPDKPKALDLILPEKQTAMALADMFPARTNYQGYDYWRTFRPQDATALADELEKRRYTTEADALRALAGLWAPMATVRKSTLDPETRAKIVRQLSRRFRHMLNPEIKADPLAAEQAMMEVADLLDDVQVGAESADVGAFGRWEVMYSQGDVIILRTKYDQIERLRIRGAKKGKDGEGWFLRVPVEQTPMLAQQLDVMNAPLAMSLRIALLSDAVREGCAELEDLASSPSIDDIPDVALRRKVEDIAGRLTFAPGLALHKFQKVGVAYAVISGYKCLIADEPGVGKTMQGIAALATDPDSLLPALVVAPASVVGSWRREIMKWRPDFRPLMLGRPTETKAILLGAQPLGPRDIVIATWGELASKSSTLARLGFQTMIADESHYMKNPGALRSKAALEVAHAPGGPEHRIAMSGTPMPNDPGEMFTQLHFIDPIAFPDKQAFNDRFSSKKKRVVQGPGGKVRVYVEHREIGDSPEQKEAILRELADTLRCYMVRRLFDDVLTEVPPKTRIPVWGELTPAGRTAYNQVEAEIMELMCANWRKRAIAEARMLIASGTSPVEALRRVNETSPDESSVNLVKLGELRQVVAEAKIPHAIEWLHEFYDARGKGTPLVIGCYYPRVIDAIGAELDKLGVKWTSIHGSVPNEERTRRIAKFQDERTVDVIILSYGAAREGINLHRADTELLVERWWVPAHEEQFEGRIRRNGQTRPTNYYYLMAEDTIDEHIAEVVDRKREILTTVLGGDRSWGAATTAGLPGENDITRGLASKFAAALKQGGSCTLTLKDLGGVESLPVRTLEISDQLRTEWQVGEVETFEPDRFPDADRAAFVDAVQTAKKKGRNKYVLELSEAAMRYLERDSGPIGNTVDLLEAKLEEGPEHYTKDEIKTMKALVKELRSLK
jgi:hypothetical protein